MKPQTFFIHRNGQWVGTIRAVSTIEAIACYRFTTGDQLSHVTATA